MPNDLREAQLLCSRLCHDLIGPAGAVNAGLELLEEAAGGAPDALALISNSAQQLTRRLAFYRLAFGSGGGDPVPVEDLRALTAEYADPGKIDLDWGPGGAGGADTELPAAAAKLLLNLVLLGMESLPRGGRLGIRAVPAPDGAEVRLTAAGDRAAIKESSNLALAGDIPPGQLTAHNIHARLAARLAAAMGSGIEITGGGDGSVVISVAMRF